MLSKTVTIDEKKMYEDILSKLDEKYELVFIDYRDELPPALVQKCIESKSIEPLYEDGVYDESRTYYATSTLDRLLEENYSEDESNLFHGTEEYDELRIEIESRDQSTPEKDLLRRSMVRAYIRFHSNYDCWLPLWEQGGIRAQGTALAGIMAALSLNPRKVKEAAIRKGVTVIGPFQNVTSREGKELVDYDAFIRVLCETPNYGNWSFFGQLDGGELHDAGFDIDSMTIPGGTTAAMFNWWNGGGSLDFCETLRPVSIGELRKRLARYDDDLRLVIDEKGVKDNGYVPSDVYGGTVSKDILLTAPN